VVATAKSLGMSGVNTKGFLLTAVVLALVVALFFIPELVSFQKSLTKSSSSALSAVTGAGHQDTVKKAQQDLALLNGGVQGDMSGAAIETASPSTAENLFGTGALGEISNLLDSGYLDQLRAKKVVSAVPQTGAVPVKGKDGLPKLTWDSLRSGASSDALKKAENDAILLAKKMPDRFSGTKFALVNFGSALRVVRSGAEKVMEPIQAVQYVDFSRLSVVRAMDREGVERDFYNRFVAISLGPVLDSQRGVGIADVPRVFNPQLTLTRVSLFRTPTRRGQWKESDARVLISLGGYVAGRDVKQVEIYRNSIRIARLTPTRVNNDGVRTFRLSQTDGRGVFTFRVIDNYGQIFERHYSFYPKARMFPWARSGYFKVPRMQVGDARVDRFFSFSRDYLVSSGSPTFFDGGMAMEQF
jgi:hypothetical protein